MTNNAVFLNSGECFVGHQGEQVMTTLGSSVAVCVYDKKLRLGGMVHFLFPEATYSPSDSMVAKNLLNFGSSAISALLREFKKLGSIPSDLESYILGGCLESDTQDDFNVKVANLNVACAQSILKKFGLEVTGLKTGVASKLKVRFDTKTGSVFVSNMKKVSVQPATILSEAIRVLIVDDSIAIQKILRATLGKFPEISIVGVASCAAEAERLRKQYSPDVMTLDIHMPDKDGVTYLGELMRTAPMPVIMVSDLSIKEASPVMKALEIGAFDYVQKPALSEIAEMGQRIRDLIIAAHQSKLKRKKTVTKVAPRSLSPQSLRSNGYDLICIGASTGGTEALRDIFSGFPSKTPPIVVVQHMPAAFTKPFAASLNKVSKVEVKEAEDGDILEACMAYIAPGGRQLRLIEKKSGEVLIQLTDDPPVNRFRPSVDYMFHSVTKLGVLKKTVAALLTGMGDDGARGLLAMKQAGAMTIAQSEESCIVFGMPKAAIERNAAAAVANLDEIVKLLFDKNLGRVA